MTSPHIHLEIQEKSWLVELLKVTENIADDNNQIEYLQKVMPILICYTLNAVDKDPKFW